MSTHNDYSREKILRLLQEFARNSGRPPKAKDPGLETLVQAAKREFGSWEYALKIAGLQTYKAWRNRRTIRGQITRILNHNPLTLRELREEFVRSSNSNIQSQTELGARIVNVIKQSSGIKSIGPMRNKIYFLVGQERLAQTRLDSILSTLPEHQEMLFYYLRKPMTKEEIKKLFPGRERMCDKWLRELFFANLIHKARFVARARGGQKYNASSLFGELACKIYYCRFDCPEEMAELVIQNVSVEKLNDVGFRASLTHRLKSILPPEAFRAWERKLFFVIDPDSKSKNSRLDYFLR